MPDRSTRTCEACGAKIMFVEGPSGAFIPLDVSSNKHIYVVSHEDDGTGLRDVVRHVVGGIYVSHFRTCRHPERFSRQAAAGGR